MSSENTRMATKAGIPYNVGVQYDSSNAPGHPEFSGVLKSMFPCDAIS